MIEHIARDHGAQTQRDPDHDSQNDSYDSHTRLPYRRRF
jgi:hypothetical protein